MIRAKLPRRNTDPWGSGEYGSPRGSRTHIGIDFACLPDSEILSPVSGKITKLGYPYGDDLSYRYVQITDDDGYDHRLFYTLPSVKRGDIVAVGDVIGISQDIAARYDERMTNHVHYEILKDGNPENPDEFQKTV